MLRTTQHRPGQQRLCAPIAHANVPRPVRRNVAVGQQGTRPSTRHQVLVRVVQEPDIKQSNAEAFIESVKESLKDQSKDEDDTIIAASIDDLQQQVSGIEQQLASLQQEIDACVNSAFRNITITLPAEPAAAATGDEQQQQQTHAFADIDDAAFAALGRDSPQLLMALLEAAQAADKAAWTAFQADLQTLKLKRQRLAGQLADARALLDAAQREASKRQGLGAASGAAAAFDAETAGMAPLRTTGAPVRTVRIVLVCGFESFNVALYNAAAKRLAALAPHIQLKVFSDRDIATRREAVAAALAGADCFFGSLLFDYDTVEWLRAQLTNVPVVLVFESALELMGQTRIGSFTMDPSGKSKGPPPAVKKVLGLFGSGREEDRLTGYLSFLKIGPQLLKFIPGKKAKDLKSWLTVYGYWNQGGLANVVSMFLYLVEQQLAPAGLPPPPPPQETPQTGCLHPAKPGYYWSGPADYMAWYAREGPLRGTDAPIVGVLLYRKHVITDQPYIHQLISQMEAEGLIPVPVFINGVEAHTVVRDQLTSEFEQAGIASGQLERGSLRRDAVKVDALLSTIGFPLVGGPAGTMEGGRQAEVAKAILGSLNVPYVVAAPLLIQDLASWADSGIQGLQSVVLYSLPELDGAIDTVPLGGLVGDDIFLVPERVSRLTSRIHKWVSLRRTPPSERRLALMLYGFPPGVGATGTAALLNVPQSLENLLASLQEAGYDLGPLPEGRDALAGLGEALLKTLKGQEEPRTVSKGAAGIKALGGGPAAAWGVSAAAAEISPSQLRSMLTFPSTWGPTEWGPMPYLPDDDVLVKRMEAQWGSLHSYRGINSTMSGGLLIPGVQIGKLWVGIQPLLGLEGDPMRLLFERDLTPHPQYAAAYKWLQQVYCADAVIHFGMHGTVEWLPGSPLGNTGLSWSDVLLGALPNVYLYAANNPSESIIAKRRGYGTIVSHNVPPYGRAGLYKQLSILRDLIADVREDPGTVHNLKEAIAGNVESSGLQADCPLREGLEMSAEAAAAVGDEEFLAWCERLHSYLQTLENRLFSEGLHVLGAPPSNSQMAQYLGAYYGDSLPQEAVDVLAEGRGVAAARSALEAAWQQPAAVRAAAAAAAAPASQAAPADPLQLLQEAENIRGLLLRNREELGGLLRALDGVWVPPEAGGDLLRDGPGVLPTGRNIHALDPYRMPGPAAEARGTQAAQAILDAHRAANGGAYPETVAINLWGLDAIKTKGESVAMVLHMVGARPVKEGTGRIARYELIPLSEMGGRPRVDCLCNMSGIFRDAFQNVVELLDDLFARAATAADEPDELNFIAKHCRALQQQGVTAGASARLFSNPAGDYGSMVNERVGAGNWESSAELGDTWAARNAFSYGKGGERGVARPEVLSSLLGSCERVVQQIDSVEYGLTDIQEYYANTGALVAAAKNARKGKAVGCSIIEAYGKQVQPKELEEVLRLEYRSKLLNPKWAQAMASQGSGGAYEISTRMTALLGWGGTVGYTDSFTWDQAADTYVLDPEMAAQLKASNPQAFRNVLGRCLEAAGRGLWQPQEELIAKLRSMYGEMDDELEGIE
ncbi:hypothetical protein OEZ85_013777 [Tetradesmus obliquus]|uniref:magnesium chelatase n=1 Tax=Tetradesmus obliquus TaxID=3088 RepID=A0ABY8U5W5_TETOB|nr:hypothetical protein OEZ85_013777 [Tetradesmus obliquus]